MKQLIAKFIGLWLNLLSLVAPRLAAKKGFALFCHPFRGKLRAFHHDFFNSAEKFDFKLYDEKVQAYKWGSGSTKVLLLHGWQSHSFRWRNYIEAIDKTQFTVYAIDAPGHGLSEGKAMTIPSYSDAIVRLLDLIGKCDVVVGHSVGSFTAFYTFHHYPELSPKKMIALAPPGSATEFINVFKRTLGVTDACMDLILAEFIRRVNKGPEYFLSSTFSTSMTFPGLIIHDEMDAETSVSNAIEIHKVWKGSKLKLTSGIGHNLKSPEIIKTVVEYMEGKHVVEARLNGRSN
jgi:pimeloyl-ACP methyl ester carboxylesterase